MGSMRKEDIPTRKKTIVPNLDEEPFYVGTTSQAIIEQSMSTAPGGDYVVRKSDKAANVFVLMLKLTHVTGMQKRIIYSQGKFIMDVGGTKRAHESLDELLKLEPMAKNPCRDKVLDLRKRTPKKFTPIGLQAGRKTSASTKQMLEVAMTHAENGRLKEASAMVEEARGLGASDKNINAATHYINSFALVETKPKATKIGGVPVAKYNMSSSASLKLKADAWDAEHGVSEPSAIVNHQGINRKSSDVRKGSDRTKNSPRRNSTSNSLVQIECRVRKDETSDRLNLSGSALCEITVDRKLTLLPKGAVDLNKNHKWPLQLLRRYGQQGSAFYFEAGTRCASGQALIYLDMTGDNVKKLFESADKALEEFRQLASDLKQKELSAIALYQQQTKLEEETKERQQSDAMAKYKQQAEIIARKQLREEATKRDVGKRKLEEERKAEEKKVQLEKERHAADRVDITKRQEKAVADRAKVAQHLTLSKRNEKAVAPHVAYTPFKQQEEWGAGKSKIWKALNPQPLYHQTAKDRREQQDKEDLGVIGGNRNFRAMMDVMEEQGFETDGPMISPVKNVNGQREVDDDLEEYDHVGDEVEEDDDDDVDSTKLADFDKDFESMLNKNREQRAIEEKKRKAQLAAEFRAERDRKQAELDKELAIIEARKKLEFKEKQRETDKAVAEAQKRLETELVFDFKF